MDPVRILVRVVVAYVVLLGLIRLSGKHTVHEGAAHDLVLTLILGDLVDNLLWGEVPAAKFMVAAGTLTLAHGLFDVVRYRAGRAE